MKTRLDLLLVERGLADTRARAQTMIREGLVSVAGMLEDKPGTLVPREADIAVRVVDQYVGRGARKILGALEAFGVDVADSVCLDVGASTGGFTDVLLARGARRVYAVDVGKGQLAWRLRGDKRVVAMERTDIRQVSDLPESIDLATVDVSFISLRLVLPSVGLLLAPRGTVMCLIKPQFEAGRRAVGRGGIVRDPVVHRSVLNDLVLHLQARDWIVVDAVESPIRGTSGNREFWMLLAPAGQSREGLTLAEAIHRALGPEASQA